MTKRILYALQGTGNGHVARAREIIPLLQKFGEVDVWLAGDQSEVELPELPRYHVRGLVLKYDKKGGVSMLKTFFGNNYLRILYDILRAPVHKYDVVINDFECITAWSCWFKNKRCIQLSHQAAFWKENAPRPKERNWLGEKILKYYAVGTEFYGFNFSPDYNKVFPPVIRSEVRIAKVARKPHYTIYLPAFHHDELVDYFSSFYKEEWEVFSKFATRQTKVYNVTVKPISNHSFLHSLSTSSGVICGAGFETPAEAMYLGKKLAVVPICNQYEQYCNAEALKQEGVLVLDQLDSKSRPQIREWIKSEPPDFKPIPEFVEGLLHSIVNNTPIAAFSR